jgi:hypothetical protein
MSWLTIVMLILSFLGPYLAEWLRDLLTRAALRVEDAVVPSPNVMSADQGMRALFEAARAELGWFEWHKSAVLYALQKVCVRRAEDFWRSAREGLTAPTPSAQDIRDIAESL